MRLQLKQMIGVLALAAAAAMLVAAAGASAASASEFKTTGKPTFTGVGLGRSTFLSEKLNLVTCEKSKSSGEIESSSLAKVTVTYETKCEIKGTVNEACPTITTKELDIKPISKLNGGTKLGLLFASKSGPIAEFTCTGSSKVTVKVTGAVLCESTPGGKPVTKGEVICKGAAAKHGEQQFTKGTYTQENRAITAGLTAESTLGFFKITEKDSQETTEDVTYSAEVEQTP